MIAGWWARRARYLLVAAAAGVLLVATATIIGRISGRPLSDPVAVMVLCAVLAAFAAALGAALPHLDAIAARATPHRRATPYAALAAAAARIRAGTLEQALPGLAQVLAEGTAAAGARVWLAIGHQLVAAAEYPPPTEPLPPRTGSVTASSVIELLVRADATLVVPVVDGSDLRAALTIDKRDDPVTPADRALLGDVAHGATLLLRTVAANAEVAARLARADSLAGELEASQQRLTRARDLARRRLVAELEHATTEPLRVLRTEITTARTALTEAGAPDCADDVAPEHVQRARAALDELLTRFRVIARGVYPAALRDHGPAAALTDLAADLTRPVHLTGTLGPRLDHEIESGLYYSAAAALALLDGDVTARPLIVDLARTAAQLTVTITDPTPTLGVDSLRRALADDMERLAALGGDLEYTTTNPPREHTDLPGTDPDTSDTAEVSRTGSLVLRVWLPDRLDPFIDAAIVGDPAATSRPQPRTHTAPAAAPDPIHPPAAPAVFGPQDAS